jgi:hypothetical protein
MNRVADDVAIAATILSLRLNAFFSLQSEESQWVLEAIRRSTSQLPHDATVEEIAAYVQSLPAAAIPGFARNVKGIAHEIAFVQAENTDGDAITAALQPAVNHPASDVVLHDHATGLEQAVQLKATDSAGYATAAVEAHPEIPVYATAEAADAAPDVLHSGFSDIGLEGQVAEVIDALDSGLDLALGGALTAGLLVALLRGGHLLARVASGGTVDRGEWREVGHESARSGLRAAVLAGVGMTSAGPLVGLYLTGRLAMATARWAAKSDTPARVFARLRELPLRAVEGRT